MIYKNVGLKTLILFMLQRMTLPIMLSIITAFSFYFLGKIPTSLNYFFIQTQVIMWVIIFFIFIITAGIGFLEYSNYTISLFDQNLKITRGILSRLENGIPYRDIKRVDVIRSIISRILGMSDIIIVTTNEEEKIEKNENYFILPYLEKTLAEAIQTHILKHAQIEQTKITNQNSYIPQT